MSEARCTLQVQGLDCPKEVDELTAALKDRPAISRLTFDVIHGVMTFDYDDSQVDPQEIIRLISDRTGMQSTLQGQIAGRPPRGGRATAGGP